MNESTSEPSAEPAKPTEPSRRPYRVSARNLAANRENAMLSTGPRTPAGKARSRLNALKHGLLASEAVNRVIEGAEARAAFDAMVDDLAAHYRPVGAVEEMLVQKIAIATWRLKRLLRFEAQGLYRAWREDQHDGYVKVLRRLRLADEAVEKHRMQTHVFRQAGVDGVTIPNEANAMLMLRYEAAVNRDLYRAMTELRRLRKEREAIGGGAGCATDGIATDDSPLDRPGDEAGPQQDSPAPSLAEAERAARSAIQAEDAAEQEKVRRVADQILDAKGISQEDRRFSPLYRTNPISSPAAPSEAASQPGAGRGTGPNSPGTAV